MVKITVRVPDGMRAGDQFVVRTPDGEQVTAAVPRGARPGDVISFEAPSKGGGGGGGGAGRAGARPTRKPSAQRQAPAPNRRQTTGRQPQQPPRQAAPRAPQRSAEEEERLRELARVEREAAEREAKAEREARVAVAAFDMVALLHLAKQHRAELQYFFTVWKNTARLATVEQLAQESAIALDNLHQSHHHAREEQRKEEEDMRKQESALRDELQALQEQNDADHKRLEQAQRDEAREKARVELRVRALKQGGAKRLVRACVGLRDNRLRALFTVWRLNAAPDIATKQQAQERQAVAARKSAVGARAAVAFLQGCERSRQRRAWWAWRNLHSRAELAEVAEVAQESMNHAEKMQKEMELDAVAYQNVLEEMEGKVRAMEARASKAENEVKWARRQLESMEEKERRRDSPAFDSFADSEHSLHSQHVPASHEPRDHAPGRSQSAGPRRPAPRPARQSYNSSGSSSGVPRPRPSSRLPNNNNNRARR